MGNSAKHLNAYLCMSQHSVYGHAIWARGIVPARFTRKTRGRPCGLKSRQRIGHKERTTAPMHEFYLHHLIIILRNTGI
jgi:hypothetical protein